MLTYRKAAAGAPAAASAMAQYLTDGALSPERARLVDYYTQGKMAEPALHDAVMAHIDDVAAGLASPGAIPARMPPDPLGPTRPDVLPQVRRDMHPRVAEALGIPPGAALSQVELTRLFAGRKADNTELPGQKRQIAFIDLCFSADKSVSVAWAFAPTEAERSMILQAHRDAVDAALHYAATVLGHVRTGAGGSAGNIDGHVGWVQFHHYSARPTSEVVRPDPVTGVLATELYTVKQAGDMLLHTHVPVFNVVVTDDGKAGSLDMQRLDGRIHEFGAYYQAHLAQNLRRIGASVELSKDGAARLTAVPEWVSREFSKRTTDGEKAAREYARTQGVDWDALAPDGRADLLKGAVKATRQAKEQLTADFGAWQAQAERMKWRHRSVLGRPGHAPAAMAREDRLEKALGVALEWLARDLEQRAAIGIGAPRVAAARGLIAVGIEDDKDIDALTRAMRQRGVTQNGETTGLIWGRDGEKAVKVTTALHVEQETDFVRLAQAATADRRGALRPEVLDRAMAATGVPYTAEQRVAIRQIGQGGRLGVVVGAAGVGKTTLMAPLVSAWRAEGRTVHGVGLAWNYATNLGDAGIAKENIAALAAFDSRRRTGKLTLGPNDVVVVDEMARLGTRQALALLRAQERDGFQIAMLGDDKQCQAIEAGPIVELLRRALGPDAVPEVLSTVRQKAEREREIAGLFREGRAAEALGMKRDDGTAEAVPGGRRAVMERVAQLYMDRRAANRDVAGYVLTVSAPTNEDARELAGVIRERRRAAGEIGPDRVVLKAEDQGGARYDLAVAQGDRLRLFQRTFGENEPQPGERPRRVWLGNNGSVVTVERVERDGLLLRGADGATGRASWEDLQHRETKVIRLAHGDVLTIDAVQSRNSTEHINALPSGTKMVQGFQAYVAESRHRMTTWLVTSDGAERQEIAGFRWLGDARPITADDVWANVARNLSRQPVKDSALAFLDRAQDLQRGTTRAMQAGLHAWESRAAQGQAPTTLTTTMALNRAAGEIGRMAHRIERQGAALGRLARPVAQSPAPQAPTGSAPAQAAPVAPQGGPPVATSVASPAAPLAAPGAPAGIKSSPPAIKSALARPPRSLPPAPTQADHIAAFHDALRQAGLVVKGSPIMDGQRHYVAVEGDKGTKKRGTYIGHLDGVPAGYIANHKTGATIRWVGSQAAKLDPAALARHRAEVVANQAARERQRAERQETVSRRVTVVWNGGAPAPADHPYLVKKGVEPHGLRVDRKGRLLVPMSDAAGRVWSLQRVAADGDKRFAKGGRAVGSFAMLGDAAPGRPVAVAEGFATAATVRQATGLPVAVAFNAGNIEAVAKALRERDPAAQIIIAADNDHHLPRRPVPLVNVGVDKAEAAAREVGAKVLVPSFEPHDKGTDWNDYAARHGLTAARDAMRVAMRGGAIKGVADRAYVPPPAPSNDQRREPRQSR